MLDLIQQRLRDYQAKTKADELNAYKEICQEIALSGLARAGFFQEGVFQGGTCLRIVHGLDRFSEDLDFVLRDANSDFSWTPYLDSLEEAFKVQGLQLIAVDRSKADNVVKKAFLKDNSFGQILVLEHPRDRSDPRSIQIKLEVDCHPPGGSTLSSHLIPFPYPFSLVAHDLPSLFAGKCVAILCRSYDKGRDWYDFLWYLQRHIKPNYAHLRFGLAQARQVPDQIDADWLRQALASKIDTTDWNAALMDVRRFLRPGREHQVAEWQPSLFHAMLDLIIPE
ncbi:MAG: nucleotidyl transferase AbiEii/AbiGii toxin family protein [Chlamydiia bacterium]|nr:nucleotidyl transferase AbiEii/AbiGii toxin family protein [Chlamydiia bacterium]